MAATKVTPAEMQGNVIGYTELPSNFVTSTTGSYVDIPALSTTVNVPAGRDVKITLFCTSIYVSTAIAMAFGIREGSNTLSQVYVNASGTALPYTIVAYVQAPTAGTHTYKASLGLGAAATATVQTATSQAWNGPGKTFMLVELV